MRPVSYWPQDTLLKLLAVTQEEKFLFSSPAAKKPGRIFGGQIIGQTLNAAIRTVEPRFQMHSLHCYFLRPGIANQTVFYEVDPIRDGGSFCTRRVVARQEDGSAIFNASMSFQIPEKGLQHQIKMPDVPPPEGLESQLEFWQRQQQKHPEKLQNYRVPPIDYRALQWRDPFDLEIDEPQTGFWVRMLEPVGNDTLLNQSLLGYMSDMKLLSTSLRAHPYITRWSKDVQAASLDHAIWFHQDFTLDDWLFYSVESPIAHASRGFSRGSYYTRDGVLVASVAQEGLIRVRN